MHKKTRSIIILITTCLILLGIIPLYAPSCSAGIITRLDKAYALRSYLDIFFDEKAANDPILPLDMIKTVPLTVNYRVQGLYSDYIVPTVENIEIFMQLSVIKTPDWCNATISPPWLSVYPKEEWNSNDATLRVKVYENAHANDRGDIIVQARVDGFGAVKGGVFEEKIPITAGYLPILKITPLTKTSVRLSPDEHSSFKLEIENLGNGKTYINMDVSNAPKDWTIGFDSQILLDRNELNLKNKQTIEISVAPPHSFGYHEETQVIDIVFTPKYFENGSIEGPDYLVSFMVKSKGFYAPGFDTSLVLIAFATLFIGFIIKKKSKIKYKKGSGS